jgi:Rrf2 family transcriptional regulator, iron-sulfur cluster assembly transcription factor
MLLTRASEYALLSLMIIAKQDAPVDTEKLSGYLKISKSFLAKILQNLARSDILNSYKGANGGFMLACDAAEITLQQILLSAEGKGVQVFNCTGSEEVCVQLEMKNCLIWSVLKTLQKKIDHFLEEITLDDLLKGS